MRDESATPSSPVEIAGELLEVRLLRLEPGDRLVVKSQRRLTVEQASTIREHILETLGVDCVVFPPDFDLVIVRDEAAA